MSRVAKVALIFLGVLAALILVFFAPDWSSDEDYWRDMTTQDRGVATAQVDFDACSNGDFEVARDCMSKKGWKLIEGGHTGPENAGRYLLLFYVLPTIVLFALAIVITRGRYRMAVLYLAGATGIAVVTYVGWGVTLGHFR